MANGIEITVEDSGFGARLERIGRRLSPVEAAPVVFKTLETAHRVDWGEGVHDEPDTTERWPGHAPLRNTGALRDSLTKSDAEGALRRVTPLWLEYGTKLPYARFLQGGTVKMRAKRVLRPAAELGPLVGAALRRWLAE